MHSMHLQPVQKCKKVHMLRLKIDEKCLIWIFGFRHFSPAFVILNLACLVTMSDRKLHVFKNSPNWLFLAFLMNSKCKHSSLRSKYWMRLFFIDICHCAYPTKMLTVRKIPIFRTLLRYFTSSGSWFHLLVENCKMMVACPHHPGFLSHNVPITITRLSSRNKSSSENQRWKWNVRKFSQNGLTKTNEKKVATCYLATLVKKNVKLESLKWWCSFFYWHFEQF